MTNAPFPKPDRRRSGFLIGATSLLVLITALGATLTFLASEGITTTNEALVVAHAETDPVPHDGDAADDPAIWINPDDAAASTIIGADKKGGIAVYDLSGRELQYLPDGNLNNVDLRAGVPLGGDSVTIVTASNRSDNSIAIYQAGRPGNGPAERCRRAHGVRRNRGVRIVHVP